MPTNDPATWAAASYTPDIGATADGLMDLCRQAVADLGLQPRGAEALLARAAERVIRHGMREGWLVEVVDGAGAGAVGNGISAQAREGIARVLAHLIDAGNARMLAQCYDVAFGLRLQGGISEAEIARQHRVTRAAVSKICRQIVETYGVKPSRAMRSEKACETYSARQRGRRARPLPSPWKYASILKHAVA